MSKHYIEKALLANSYKIERIKKESGFIVRHINKVIVLGTIFSFLAPFYSSENGKTMRDYMPMSYSESVIFTASFIAILCVIGHIGWTIQDHFKLKRLYKRKIELENQLKAYD